MTTPSKPRGRPATSLPAPAAPAAPRSYVLTQVAFARLVGAPRQHVHNAIRAGKLPVDDRNQVRMPEGKIAWDALRAMLEGDGRTRAARQARGQQPSGAAAKKRAVVTAPAAEQPGPDAAPLATGDDADDDESDTTAASDPSDLAPGAPAAVALDLRRAQLDERHWKARIAELEYQQRRGELVPLVEVQADARAACEVIRSQLLSLGPRIALLLECDCRRAASVQAIVDDEVNAILTVLHGTRFSASR